MAVLGALLASAGGVSLHVSFAGVAASYGLALLLALLGRRVSAPHTARATARA